MSLSMPISNYLYPSVHTHTTHTLLPPSHSQTHRDHVMFCQSMNIFYGKNRIPKGDCSIVLFNKVHLRVHKYKCLRVG